MHTPIALDSYNACTEFPRPMPVVVSYMHTYIHVYIHAYKHTYNWLHLDIRHNSVRCASAMSLTCGSCSGNSEVLQQSLVQRSATQHTNTTSQRTCISRAYVRVVFIRHTDDVTSIQIDRIDISLNVFF